MTIEIDFPFSIDATGRTATTGYDEHVRDMVEQLLFTTPGERVNRPEFGAGLLDVVFSPNSPVVAATLEVLIQSAIQRELGDVLDLEELEVRSEEATLRIGLRYVVRRTLERRATLLEAGVA